MFGHLKLFTDQIASSCYQLKLIRNMNYENYHSCYSGVCKEDLKCVKNLIGETKSPLVLSMINTLKESVDACNDVLWINGYESVKLRFNEDDPCFITVDEIEGNQEQGEALWSFMMPKKSNFHAISKPNEYLSDIIRRQLTWPVRDN